MLQQSGQGYSPDVERIIEHLGTCSLIAETYSYRIRGDGISSDYLWIIPKARHENGGELNSLINRIATHLRKKGERLEITGRSVETRELILIPEITIGKSNRIIIRPFPTRYLIPTKWYDSLPLSTIVSRKQLNEARPTKLPLREKTSPLRLKEYSAEERRAGSPAYREIIFKKRRRRRAGNS